MQTLNQALTINKAKKLDLNFFALEFTESKYQALARINEAFYNDSYKKSAFLGLSYDEVIVTHGSTNLKLLEVIKMLSTDLKEFECRFRYNGTTYLSNKGTVSKVEPDAITLI
jgi:hypothetical protein